MLQEVLRKGLVEASLPQLLKGKLASCIRCRFSILREGRRALVHEQRQPWAAGISSLRGEPYLRAVSQLDPLPTGQELLP